MTAAAYHLAEPIEISAIAKRSITKALANLERMNRIASMPESAKATLALEALWLLREGTITEQQLEDAWHSHRPARALRDVVESAMQAVSDQIGSESVFEAKVHGERIVIEQDWQAKIYRVPTSLIPDQLRTLRVAVAKTIAAVAQHFPHCDMTAGGGSRAGEQLMDLSHQYSNEELIDLTNRIQDEPDLMEGELEDFYYIYHLPSDALIECVNAVKAERALSALDSTEVLDMEALAAMKAPKRFTRLVAWVTEAQQWLASAPEPNLFAEADSDIPLYDGTYLYACEDTLMVIDVDLEAISQSGEMPNAILPLDISNTSQKYLPQLLAFAKAHQLAEKLDNITKTIESTSSRKKRKSTC